MIKKVLLGTIVLGLFIGVAQGAWQGGNYTLPFEYTNNYSDIIIDKNLNITNFEGGKIGLFKINDYNNYIRWNDGKLYWYYNYGTTCRYQGEMDKMCIGALNQARNPTPVPGICTSNYLAETAESFYNGEFGTEFETILLSNDSNAYDLYLCFLDTTDNNTTYCFSARAVSDKQFPCYGTFEDLQSNITVGDSPFAGGGDFPDIVGSGSKSLTNGDVIVGLSYRYGFSENSCYGGYPIDNLFVSGSDPKDFTGFLMGTGASIFDIYNSYSGSYFTGIVNFYDSFYSRYRIGNLASFWDYPKGLYSIVERAYLLSQSYNLYPMNMSSLVEYCNLYLNSDWDSLYTGNNIVGQQGYNSLIGEITDKWRYYDTDLFSGSDISGSVSIDEFFETISNRLVGGLQDVADNRVGVIPSYILMVMMALILFRLISH